MNYQRALDFLMSLTDWEAAPAQAFAAQRFDLARVRSLLARLDDPHLGRRTVHVAGSKGKGSVAAMVASVLGRADRKSTRLNSSHQIISYAVFCLKKKKKNKKRNHTAETSLATRLT